MKFTYFLIFLVFIFPIVSFAQISDANDLLVIALLREQIRLLQEIIKILIARSVPATLPSPAPSVLIPLVSAEEKPFVRISANGSGGLVSVKKGEKIILSWKLSNHNWSYCGKLVGWEGTLKPISGSEEVGSIFYDTRYDIFCYINSTKYSDSVTVAASQPISVQPAATTSPLKPAFSITDPGFRSCSLEVSPNSATMGKDALEATWVIDSDPRQAFFYWRGKDNGVDIGKVYGGKTQRVRLFDYPPYPAKYERYVETFFSQDHLVGDPYTPGCTTKTVTFEIKQ